MGSRNSCLQNPIKTSIFFAYTSDRKQSEIDRFFFSYKLMFSQWRQRVAIETLSSSNSIPNLKSVKPQSVVFVRGMRITMETRLLTAKDIISMCSVGYSTLYRWRKNGVFPESIGVGKLLWTEQQITEWIDQRTTPVTNIAVTSPIKRKRQENRERQERDAAIEAALEHHRVRKK